MNQRDFSSLVQRLKNRMFRIALDIVKQTELAEDVVQEVFIKVWDKRQEMAVIENLDAYCIRMTRNLSIDKTRLKHFKNQDLSTAYSLHHGDPSPSKQTELDNIVDMIKVWMKDLPQSQREVLVLRDFEGFSYQEIADTLDIPLNQVKVYLFRARQYLRTKMTKYQ
jgi:RNA polymerase sigma factor (sigma-70 family)